MPVERGRSSHEAAPVQIKNMTIALRGARGHADRRDPAGVDRDRLRACGWVRDEPFGARARLPHLRHGRVGTIAALDEPAQAQAHKLGAQAHPLLGFCLRPRSVSGISVISWRTCKSNGVLVNGGTRSRTEPGLSPWCGTPHNRSESAASATPLPVAA